jgi:hypothetical protein
MQDWREIIEFPGYSVGDAGFVRNDETGRIMQQTKNTRGIAIVGLVKRGVQYKRSVACLVADAFILTARSLEFNTPINLDGDRFNNHVNNLAWRPRWFAVKYFQQFAQEAPCFNRPIMEAKTGEVFDSSWVAALTFGLLDRQLAMAIMNRTYVWPTYQMFQLLR